jgi:hypothetical protein
MLQQVSHNDTNLSRITITDVEQRRDQNVLHVLRNVVSFPASVCRTHFIQDATQSPYISRRAVGQSVGNFRTLAEMCADGSANFRLRVIQYLHWAKFHKELRDSTLQLLLRKKDVLCLYVSVENRMLSLV